MTQLGSPIWRALHSAANACAERLGPRPAGSPVAPARTCLAVHEAGHATVGLVVGRRFSVVSIVARQVAEGVTDHGRCTFEPLGDRHALAHTSGGRTVLRNAIMAAMAGTIADRLHCGALPSDDHWHRLGDFGSAMRIARLLSDDDEDRAASLLLDATGETAGALRACRCPRLPGRDHDGATRRWRAEL